MRRKIPKDMTARTLRKFLWFPRRVYHEMVWLEFVYVEQIYWPNLGWANREWRTDREAK